MLNFLLVMSIAQASEVFYMNSKKAVIDSHEAIKASMDGEVIVQCGPVKASVNKKGTAITLKKVK